MATVAKKPAAKPAATAAKKPAAKPAAATAKKPVAAAKASKAAPAPKKPAAKPAASKVAAAKAPAKAAVVAKKGPAKTVAPAKSVTAKPAVAAKKAPAKVVAKPVAAAPSKKPVAKPAAPAPAVKKTVQPMPVSTKPATSKPAPSKAAPQKPAAKKGGAALLTEAELLKMSDKDYMNDAQQAFFRAMLQAMKDDILENARETGEHLKENEVFADPNDRATVEEENMLEQRVRDRERKLLKKIDSALRRLDAGEYGFCLETGEPIGIGRLLARPTAELSIEAQEKHERMEKLFAD